MHWESQNQFIIEGISLWWVCYSGVCFHIFYCNTAGLSNVVCYNGVFIIAEFVIVRCHCTMSTSAGVGNPVRDIPHMVSNYCNLVVLCPVVQEWVTHLGIFSTWLPITAT